MNRPVFPGTSDNIPEISEKLPSVTLNGGIVVLSNPKTSNSALASEDVEILLHEIKDEIDLILSLDRDSNMDAMIFDVIERLDRVLNSEDNHTKEVRVGLALSSVEKLVAPLIRDQHVSVFMEGRLSQLASIGSLIEARLPTWGRFKLLRDSIDISEADVKNVSTIYSSMNDCLEEAADLVSEEVVLELDRLAPLVEGDLSMEKEITYAKIATVNNVIVGLLQEVRTKQGQSETWVAKMLAVNLITIISGIKMTILGALVFGWIKSARSAIQAILELKIK